MKVALIGAGSWGCALASLLLANKHVLHWWVHREDIAESLQTLGIHPSIFPEYTFEVSQIEWAGTKLSEALTGVEAVVLALPSRYVEEVLSMEEALPRILWISCTKGLLPNKLQTSSEYLKQRGIESIAVLSGPSHAEEVISRLHTWVVVGAPSTAYYATAEKLFSQPYFHLLYSPYRASLEWVGVLKNIYAIGMGVVASWGDNARAALATVALQELEAVLKALVPKEKPTFLSPGWAGDFLVTAFSNHSRNQRFGRLLAQGYTAKAALQHLGMVAEGYYAAQTLRLWKRYEEFPLLAAVIQAVREEANPTFFQKAVLRILSDLSEG
ncbi:MAG: NAD(P)-binding domain-containing protein [Bacteroidia bacterium]|nr:NAD(P)-binding domain-containing protein [Bacteroidia bacterium]MDW8133734.1 NAD(P)-binding domain-containing protein [Bacteroidia bacterium]